MGKSQISSLVENNNIVKYKLKKKAIDTCRYKTSILPVRYISVDLHNAHHSIKTI